MVLGFSVFLSAQKMVQTVKGKVVDIDSKISIPGANVVIINTEPLLGTTTDADGNFKIEKVPVGRYSIQISSIGYNANTLSEILVSSGKELELTIEMKEQIIETKEVVVTLKIEKDKPLNPMATVSARSVSVEEASRYAGAIDDPLRAVSSFAGVATFGSVDRNDIIVRGNSPRGLLWRLDGVDIPNPNHYGQIGNSGGGVSIFSSQLLANSDFFTAAFPAEYGNALAGVFDIKFRNGNNDKREYTFQAGIFGIDASAEGPIVKGKRSSFLFNYRYSTFGILKYLNKEMKNKIPDYQDLSFKLNMPTKAFGTFSITAIGGFDHSGVIPEKDTTKWIKLEHREKSKFYTAMGAISANHTVNIGKNTFFKSSIVATGNQITYTYDQFRTGTLLKPKDSTDYSSSKIAFSTNINHKFGKRITNKTGIILNELQYSIDIKSENPSNGIFKEYVHEKGTTQTAQFYNQTKIDITDNVTINAGLHSQYFVLNGRKTLEPRASLKWHFSEKQTISLGYGNHSQIENIGIYLAESKDANGKIFNPNKNLNLARANHYVIGYDLRLGEYSHLKLEPYYQRLYNIPIVRGSSFSLLNSSETWYNDSMINKGTGVNRGLDITLERYLHNNFYCMTTVSLFDSKYKAGDSIERNTRFNNHFVINILVGREFLFSDKHVLGVNIKGMVNGGEWYTPIDLDASIAAGREVLDIRNTYNKQSPSYWYIDASTTWKTNHQKWTGTWFLQIKNVLNQQPLLGYVYNPYSKQVEEQKGFGLLPFLSYKVEF